MFQNSSQIATLFTALKAMTLPGQDEYVGLTAPGRSNDFVAIDSQSNLILLVSCGPSALDVTRTTTRSLSVLPVAQLIIHSPAGPIAGTFLGVRLSADRTDLEEVFALVASGLFDSLALSPDAGDILSLLEELAQLFALETTPDPAVIKGLWGELWTIASSASKDAWVEAWHRRPEDKFDFGFSRLDVEVKCAEGDRPIHHFSQDQLRLRPLQTTVISHLIVSSTAGLSLAELADRISVELGANLRLKFFIKLYRVIGTELESTDDFRFVIRDRPACVISAENVPSVPDGYNLAIGGLSFTVDLTQALEAWGRPLAEVYELVGEAQ